jgi:hypothetical protein
MSDQASNDKAQAAMRERNSNNLNTSGKEGVVVRSPRQAPDRTRPTNHVDPASGKRS